MAKLSEEKTANTDIRALALNNLINLERRIKNLLPSVSDRISRAHLQYLLKEIEAVVGDTNSMERSYRPIKN